MQQDEDRIDPHFEVGDLVRFVYVEKGNHPQIWNRNEGLGVILDKKLYDLSDTAWSYTVLSGGKSFECIEVYHIEESKATRDENESKHIEK